MEQKLKTVILTGAGGFIGHHCVEHWLTATPWRLLLLDSFRHKGTFSHLNAIKELDNPAAEWHSGIHDLRCPIDDVARERLINLSSGKIDAIVNMASNSAVGRSVQDPRECWENNCAIAINILEFARSLKPHPLVIQISTDEVYGDCRHYPIGDSCQELRLHPEWDTIIPSNPYAASKAAQEALCISYWRTYKMPIVIVNTMNNFGERQDIEKFIPQVIRRIKSGQQIPIYTDNYGKVGSRCYLHCKDHAECLRLLIESGVGKDYCYRYGGCSGPQDRPERFNICGSRPYDNLEVAQMIARMMGAKLDYVLVPPIQARPGYDAAYGLDNGHTSHCLNWNPPRTIDDRLLQVVKWTLENPEWLALSANL